MPRPGWTRRSRRPRQALRTGETDGIRRGAGRAQRGLLGRGRLALPERPGPGPAGTGRSAGRRPDRRARRRQPGGRGRGRLRDRGRQEVSGSAGPARCKRGDMPPGMPPLRIRGPKQASRTSRYYSAGSRRTITTAFPKDRSMSARSLNWLKFGGLVALAFALGLLFAGLLDLPNRGSAQEQGRQASAIAQVPAPVDSGRPPAPGPERGLRGGGGARQAERGLHPLPADRARHRSSSGSRPGWSGSSRPGSASSPRSSRAAAPASSSRPTATS